MDSSRPYYNYQGDSSSRENNNNTGLIETLAMIRAGLEGFILKYCSSHCRHVMCTCFGRDFLSVVHGQSQTTCVFTNISFTVPIQIPTQRSVKQKPVTYFSFNPFWVLINPR